MTNNNFNIVQNLETKRKGKRIGALIPTHFLLIFKVPINMASRIENCRDFLSLGFRDRKSDHLVGWDLVCTLKKVGGLGVRDNLLKE